MESTQTSIIAAKQSQSTPDLHKLTVIYKYKSLHYVFILFNFFFLPYLCGILSKDDMDVGDREEHLSTSTGIAAPT